MIPKTARLISWKGDLPSVGHYLQTSKKSTYLVIGVKLNLRPVAKSIAKLDLLKLCPDDKMMMTDDSIIHYFQWGNR